MKNRYMKILNLNKFAKYITKNIAKTSGLEIKEKNLSNFITLKNVKGIIAEHARFKNGNYYVNSKILTKIEDSILGWLVGVSLAKSAANGEIECYWDDSKDCMMFSNKGKNNGKETF